MGYRMNDDLRSRIERMRAVLERDPDGITAGELRPAAESNSEYPDKSCEPYQSFLEVCDGGRFGSIDVWSSREIEGKQFVAVDFPGGPDAWLVVGQILYEPIACDGQGRLRLFVRGGPDEGEDLGQFDEFFMGVFGAEYRGIVANGDLDPWWQALGSAGLR
jgi:hypothetical protein